MASLRVFVFSFLILFGSSQATGASPCPEFLHLSLECRSELFQAAGQVAIDCLQGGECRPAQRQSLGSCRDSRPRECSDTSLVVQTLKKLLARSQRWGDSTNNRDGSGSSNARLLGTTTTALLGTTVGRGNLTSPNRTALVRNRTNATLGRAEQEAEGLGRENRSVDEWVVWDVNRGRKGHVTSSKPEPHDAQAMWNFFFYPAHEVTESSNDCWMRTLSLLIFAAIISLINSYTYSVGRMKEADLRRSYLDKRYNCIANGRPVSYCVPYAIQYAKEKISKTNYQGRRLVKLILFGWVGLSVIDAVFTAFMCLGLFVL